MKICPACKQEKEIVEFYKSKFTKDGCSSACKKCSLIRMDFYFKGVGSKKNKVRAETRSLVSSGRIKRGNCSVCGKKAEAHHNDYDNPLDITWFCKKHHMEEHRRIKGLNTITGYNRVDNVEIKAIRSTNTLYCKTKRISAYRKAFMQGIGVSKISETWSKGNKTHCCCGSRTIWRHKLKCTKINNPK